MCGDLHVVEEAVGHRVDDHHLLLDRHRLVLRLLEHLDQPRAALELPLGRRVEVGAELGERLELAVLRQDEPQRPGHLLHRLDLGGAAHAAHGDADVHRGTDAGVEEVGLEEDLAVGDRDDVGRDVRRDVAGLGLDDRERGERAARLLDRSSSFDHVGVLGDLGRALEQAAVEVEHVARIRLASRRTAQHERELAVRRGLLGQVVVDAERRLPLVVHEVLGHGAAGVRRDVLQRRGSEAEATTTMV